MGMGIVMEMEMEIENGTEDEYENDNEDGSENLNNGNATENEKRKWQSKRTLIENDNGHEKITEMTTGSETKNESEYGIKHENESGNENVNGKMEMGM